MEMTNGVMPVYNVGENSEDNDMMGGSWIWIILLFFLFGSGNGFGGKNDANGLQSAISNDFLYTNLNNSINTGFTQLVNGQFGLSKELCQGFSGVQNGISTLGYQTQAGFQTLGSQMASCCCETNRNIDAVRYENAKNTCDIITAGNMNTQRIVDTITANEINTLRTDLQAAQLALSNTAQTQNIVNTLRPVPQPAYVTCSPYQAYGAYNGGGCSGC